MAAASLQVPPPSPQLNSSPSLQSSSPALAQAPNSLAAQPSAGLQPQPTALSSQIIIGGPPLPGPQVAGQQIVGQQVAGQLNPAAQPLTGAASLAAPALIETTSGASIPVPTLKKAATAQPQLAAIEPVIISTPVAEALAVPTSKDIATTEEPVAPATSAKNAAKVAEITADPGVQNLTATPVLAEAAPKPRKKTLFESMFGSPTKPAAAAEIQESPPAPSVDKQLALAEPTSQKAFKPVALSGGGASKNVELASLDKPLTASEAAAPDNASDNGDLPGVRKGALFEIKRRDANGNDLDVDISETDNGPIQLASAAGLARLAPNGLRVQRETVDVACLKPQLVKMLKSIETHYGQSLVITSGYRSPGHNRQVRGAKNSLHMFCAAADFQVPGVSKWDLAKYLRSMPNRGGVGTYCNTESVHIDIGPDRDWNWRCSRRK
jgi:uncharacterized protein YcbK (DUF882 family)